MPVWLLAPRPDVVARGPENPSNPWWRGGWDCLWRVVVRAETEEAARLLATSKGGNELKHWSGNVWLNPEFTLCEELDGSGEEEVLVHDFKWG